MVDYFLFKQATYKNILDNFDKIGDVVLFDVQDYSKDDYFKTLKSSIRMTYFHAIETLFELIFAIEQGVLKEINEHQDELILQRLASSDFRRNFERIEEIGSEQQLELDKLDVIFRFKTVNEPISLLRYIFYYTLTPDKTTFDKSYWDKMEESLKAIKSVLITLAKDFSDRKEYNSYKHGLRILPLSRKFQAFKNDTNKEIINLDFSDSMTFIHQHKNELSIITKAFDTERDFKMTIVVSYLIANIINIRKGLFFNKEGDQTYVRFFDSTLIDDLSKSNISARDLKFILTYTNNLPK